MRRPAGHPYTAIVLLAVLAACGGDRPSAAEWGPIWDTEQAAMPSADELAAGGQAGCDRLVAELRAGGDRLRPTPSEALDAAVESWLEHAKGIAFDCVDDVALLDEQYAELDILTAEVDAGLSAEP